MPIDETKCCGGQTKNKVESGECCQTQDQEKAEQDTYEYSIKTSPEPKEINE